MLAAVACRPAPKAAPPANDPADVAAVEQVLTRWYDAFERHDSAGVAAPLLPTFFIFEDTTRIGRDDLIAGMVGGFSQGNQTAALSDFATEVRGDVAWTSFRNREVWTPADGSPSDTLDFLESVVFEKRDGVWLMERYHATRINRPAPPA
jgi:ketosteroid isomerase-like protein